MLTLITVCLKKNVAAIVRLSIWLSRMICDVIISGRYSSDSLGGNRNYLLVSRVCNACLKGLSFCIITDIRNHNYNVTM